MADEILIDEYTLLNHIATGGSTQVWEAIEKGGGDRHWAMKLMLPEALAQSEHRNVLKHEAKLAERFNHPNLVRFQKLVMTKKRGYMVMDYFRAPNLKAQLQSDAVSLQARLVRLFEQLCQVLGYLHDQGWVHRDVKPDNILFNRSSELRLIDFSLTTRAAGAVSKLIGGKEKVIQGTRTYISPETILKAPPSPQADIYSLGITLFEILTGDPPFVGSSPDDLLKKHLTSAAPPPSCMNDNVTPEMDRFVLKMLAKRTKDRHKNTHELLAEFRNIKPFKEDVSERDRRLKKEREERYQSTLDKSGRLDSRADHLKQQLLKDNPTLAKEEAEKKKALAAAAAAAKKPVAKEKAAPAKSGATVPSATVPSATVPSATVPSAPAARPAAPAPAAPAPPQAPPMPGYPPGYGYPGQMPAAYPMPGYPQTHAGYPQPAGYPQGPGYPPGGGYPQAPPGGGYPQPPGYPGGGQVAAGYPQGGYAPAPGQPPMAYPQMQPPGSYAPNPYAPNPYAPGQPPMAGYPAGAVPYGNQTRQAGVSAPRGAAPARQAPGSPAIDEQQELLQQLLAQPAAPTAGAQRPPQGQPPAQRPAAPAPGPPLPLMDQLPPVK